MTPPEADRPWCSSRADEARTGETAASNGRARPWTDRLYPLIFCRIARAAARNAGCAFALVEWGFLGRPPEGIDADLVVSTPEELVQKLVL